MINLGVSDLWFNTDKDDAKLPPESDGSFAGYDEEKLQELAEDFITNLSFAGVDVSGLNAEVLIDDFNRRV